MSTKPDPFLQSEQCTMHASVTLTDATCGSFAFALPRTNIMSYYGSPSFPTDKIVTSGQGDAIHLNLTTSSLRKRLE